MRHVGVISLLLLSGCFSPVIDGSDGGTGGGTSATGGGSAAGGGTASTGGSGTGGSAGGGTSATGGGVGGGDCAQDSDCSHGMVCDPCGGVLSCAPGCRNDGDCGRPLTCQGGVACLTCPCAMHYCALNPCIDVDGDGFVSGSSSCESKPGGDCDDTNASVHPGALERCDDGIDNDCNGLVDGQDPACQSQFCPSGDTCQSNFDCKLGTSYCAHDPAGVHGCCNSCPPTGGACQSGYVMVSGGVDGQTGCPTTRCVMAMGGCPANFSPVCSTEGATYGNPCEAQLAQATILHAGECLDGEGLDCNPGDPSSCGPSADLYCRDGCPVCDAFDFHCAERGACVEDYDCPAGEPPVPGPMCMGGTVWSASCTNHACVYSCK